VNIQETVQQLKTERSEPLCAYLYDMNRLRDHVETVVRSLPDRCRMFYAMKANSEYEILQALAPIVDGLEVASLGEVEKARAVSTDIPVIFGGPGKTDQEIEGAIRHRVTRFHVESLHELRRIGEIAKRLQANVSILLRVNLSGPFPSATLSMAGRPTQFGMNEEEVSEAIRTAQASAHVCLKGFHFHSISNQLDAQSHLQLLNMYREKVEAWEEAYGLKVTAVNVGGGIGVNYQDLDAQFDWPLFVDGLKPLVEGFPSHWRHIDFECGRYLTAACGYYACEVLDIKRNHGKNYVLVRGGTHHFRLPVSWQHSHPFEVVPVEKWPYSFERIGLKGEPVTITGQLCTPKDVMARDIRVDRVRIGDILLFQYTGAYSWSISHHDFLSHPHPEHLYLEHPAVCEPR
jgi:2-[(L-alanin-3-ylcarbamoyl)methyl]-2-hydroxybutanedioate decarboxylase